MSHTRRHGCELPWDPHQIGAVIFFSILVSGCYAFYVPLVTNNGAKYTLLVLYSVLVAFIFGLYFWTSCSDPSDPGLKGGHVGEYYCGLCNAHVASTSKHCRSCERCVDGFDHHCKWLNNCIGLVNYRQFFFLVTVTVSLLTVQLAWGIWLFARSFYDSDNMELTVQQQYNNAVNFDGWRVALALYLALCSLAIFMLGELLFFHVVLVIKGMTTYDYILAQRDGQLNSTSATAPEPKQNMLCRSSRVADQNQSMNVSHRKKVKVHINPFAAMTTEKPQGGPRNRPGPGAAGTVSPRYNAAIKSPKKVEMYGSPNNSSGHVRDPAQLWEGKGGCTECSSPMQHGNFNAAQFSALDASHMPVQPRVFDSRKLQSTDPV